MLTDARHLMRRVVYLAQALRADGVQIVILDSPEIYSEYAPYTYIEDLKEFIDKVAQMNRVAPVFRKH